MKKAGLTLLTLLLVYPATFAGTVFEDLDFSHNNWACIDGSNKTGFVVIRRDKKSFEIYERRSGEVKYFDIARDGFGAYGNTTWNGGYYGWLTNGAHFKALSFSSYRLEIEYPKGMRVFDTCKTFSKYDIDEIKNWLRSLGEQTNLIGEI